VRLLLNLIWLIFGGLVLAFAYAVTALVMFILIITIPFGIASARIALFCLWPFGRTLVRRPDAGAGSLIRTRDRGPRSGAATRLRDTDQRAHRAWTWADVIC
jgi:uncharacterized membrane protein YccF (DUF307 family)